MRAAPDGVVPLRVIARISRRVGFISPSSTQGCAKKTASSLVPGGSSGRGAFFASGMQMAVLGQSS